MIKPDLKVELPENISQAHFCGIGGSGMTALARMFVERGIAVTGSDRERSYNFEELETLGIDVEVGHDPEYLGEADTFIYTGALEANNSEYLEAQRRGLPLLHRSQALKWLTRGKRVVSVAGAHGKSSTVGMLATALKALEQDPCFVSGARVNGLDLSSHSGEDDLFILEADESDGSFLHYDTSVAVINNIDLDHVDHYGSQEELEKAFYRFAASAKNKVVISADDPACLNLISRLNPKRVITFGRSAKADVRLEHVSGTNPTCFTLVYGDTQFTACFKSKTLFGEHQALNMCGALAALLALGWELRPAIVALTNYEGSKRRLELREESKGVQIYDDYAHHPAEVSVALAALRNIASGRIIAFHQPHTYSRTQAFHKEFAVALENGADMTVVVPVCAAREEPIPGVSGKLVFESFKIKDRCRYFDDWETAAHFVARYSREGDLVVTLGCGDVYRAIPQIVSALKNTVVRGRRQP